MMTKEDIFLFRIKHPNCMYCDFLINNHPIIYYCEKRKNGFLFCNKIRAKHCSNYKPRIDDLDLAIETLKRLEDL